MPLIRTGKYFERENERMRRERIEQTLLEKGLLTLPEGEYPPTSERLGLVRSKTEKKPLFERDENGRYVPVNVPGLEKREQVINEPRPPVDKEDPATSVYKDILKKGMDKIAVGDPLSQTYLAQMDAAAKHLGQVKVMLPGKMTPKTNWRGKAVMDEATGKQAYDQEDGVPIYMPKAEADLRDNAIAELKKEGYSDVQLANNQAIVQAAMDQMRGKAKKKK